MFRLSTHAINQANRRGFNSRLAETKVNSMASLVYRLGKDVPDYHVYVILHKFPMEIERPGCRGDNLIACVDVKSNKITTIMLQTTKQVIRNEKIGWRYVEAK